MKNINAEIETGRAAIINGYIIRQARNAMNEANGLGVWVWERGGENLAAIHQEGADGLLEPVSFDEAVAWADQH